MVMGSMYFPRVKGQIPRTKRDLLYWSDTKGQDGDRVTFWDYLVSEP